MIAPYKFHQLEKKNKKYKTILFIDNYKLARLINNKKTMTFIPQIGKITKKYC